MVLRGCGRLAWGGRAARFAAEPPHTRMHGMDRVCVCVTTLNRQIGSPTQEEERGWRWAHHGESEEGGRLACLQLWRGAQKVEPLGKSGRSLESELPLALEDLLVPRLAASFTLPSRSWIHAIS